MDPFPLDGDRKTANFPDRSPESTEGRRSCRAETVGAATQRRASERASTSIGQRQQVELIDKDSIFRVDVALPKRKYSIAPRWF